MTDQRHSSLQSQVELVVGAIRGLREAIEQLEAKFRLAIAAFEKGKDAGLLKTSDAFWQMVAHVDALVRVRLFIEQNFTYIESMGLLAVTRYLFELMVWLKLMHKDKRYGLVYYQDLLVAQLKYHKDLRDHLNKEVVFLQNFAVREKKLMEDGLAEALAIPDPQKREKALLGLNKEVTQKIDSAAARKFSLYAEQARINGYSFQAHLVEKKILPEVSDRISATEQELNLFDRNAPPDVIALIQKRRNWKDWAEKVDMKDEYDFVYSYTSRLLHVTALSLTTDHKNLELDEVWIFLKYIHVRLLDVIDFANRVLAVEGKKESGGSGVLS